MNNADRLLEMRGLLGATQAEMAERLGVSRNYIYLIESGKKEPGAKFLRNLERIEHKVSNDASAIANKLEGDDFDDIKIRRTGKYTVERRSHYLKESESSFDNAPDADLKTTLLECVRIDDWGGVELLAKELHRRKLLDLNQQIQQMKNKREADAG